jgi:hypothetical protein
MTVPQRISDRYVRSNQEIDARVRALVERLKREENLRPRRVDERYNASELTPMARAELGFPPDWKPPLDTD